MSERRHPEDIVTVKVGPPAGWHGTTIAYRTERIYVDPWCVSDPNPFPRLRLWSLFSRKGAQHG